MSHDCSGLFLAVGFLSYQTPLSQCSDTFSGLAAGAPQLRVYHSDTCQKAELNWFFFFKIKGSHFKHYWLKRTVLESSSFNWWAQKENSVSCAALLVCLINSKFQFNLAWTKHLLMVYPSTTKHLLNVESSQKHMH